jgi:hypothetical protein
MLVQILILLIHQARLLNFLFLWNLLLRLFQFPSLLKVYRIVIVFALSLKHEGALRTLGAHFLLSLFFSDVLHKDILELLLQQIANALH